MRQIVLDTETTGLDPAKGHRIIEIGCVELINRKRTGNELHQYLQPDREIDPGAIEVHGITNEFLTDKPRFEDIAGDFLAYIDGAELIIHNAPFDVGFLDHEFERAGLGSDKTDDVCDVIDTLVMARRLHPGQKNSLDALCKRYTIDNSQRDLHGALLDAELLAEVYLAMTGGQTTLFIDSSASRRKTGLVTERKLDPERGLLPVIRACEEELAAHGAWLEELDKQVGGACLWRQMISKSRETPE
jgi:DNA polymerase-3 subunit epsilon